jgi:hypothetical protein
MNKVLTTLLFLFSIVSATAQDNSNNENRPVNSSERFPVFAECNSKQSKELENCFYNQVQSYITSNFNVPQELVSSNYYSMVQMNKGVFVIENPAHIKLNQSKELHCLHDYAIKWQDNTGMNFINGRYLKNRYFELINSNKFTLKEFLEESNEETKSTCIAFLQEKNGDTFLVDFFSDYLKKIDTFVHKKESKYLKGTTNSLNLGVYDLFKGSINGLDIAYVRCYDFSTDRMFFLGVEPKWDNAKDAIASLYRVPEILKPHILTIQRQGERYSTNFSKEGVELLKTLDFKNIKYDCVSGQEYFEKLGYEY